MAQRFVLIDRLGPYVCHKTVWSSLLQRWEHLEHLHTLRVSTVTPHEGRCPQELMEEEFSSPWACVSDTYEGLPQMTTADISFKEVVRLYKPLSVNPAWSGILPS